MQIIKLYIYTHTYTYLHVHTQAYLCLEYCLCLQFSITCAVDVSPACCIFINTPHVCSRGEAFSDARGHCIPFLGFDCRTLAQVL